jgi:hypothetical protein
MRCSMDNNRESPPHDGRVDGSTDPARPPVATSRPRRAGGGRRRRPAPPAAGAGAIPHVACSAARARPPSPAPSHNLHVPIPSKPSRSGARRRRMRTVATATGPSGAGAGNPRSRHLGASLRARGGCAGPAGAGGSPLDRAARRRGAFGWRRGRAAWHVEVGSAPSPSSGAYTLPPSPPPSPQSPPLVQVRAIPPRPAARPRSLFVVIMGSRGGG